MIQETQQCKKKGIRGKKPQYSKYMLCITSFHLLTPQNFLLGTTAVSCAMSWFYIFSLVKGKGRICIWCAYGGIWPAEYGPPAFGSHLSLSTLGHSRSLRTSLSLPHPRLWVGGFVFCPLPLIFVCLRTCRFTNRTI